MFNQSASTEPVEMLRAITTMLEVRATWVTYRGEPTSQDERELMTQEVARLTAARLVDPSSELNIKGKACRRRGCKNPVPVGKQVYCKTSWCNALRQSESRQRWYQNKIKKEEGRTYLREQSKKAMQALRARRRAAGLTGEGTVPKRRQG